MQIAELISKLNIPSQTEASMASLAALGLPAVKPIFEAMRSEVGATQLLASALLRINHPDLANLLIEYLGDKNTDVALASFEALGKTKADSALEPLLTHLHGPRAALAVQALGELGNRRAMPALVELAAGVRANPELAPIFNFHEPFPSEELDESPLRLLPVIIIALARLGHFEISHWLAPLSRYRSKDPDSEAALIRATAVEAMQNVTFPGLFVVLKDALADELTEVRLNAVEALFYLGAKESIRALIACLKDPSTTLVTQVLYRLHGLTGNQFDRGNVPSPEEWWAQSQAAYLTNVCYRLGLPLHIPNIISILEQTNDRSSILKELWIITDVNFGLPTSNDVLTSALNWWKENDYRFEPGRLFKHGYSRDLSTVIREPQ